MSRCVGMLSSRTTMPQVQFKICLLGEVQEHIFILKPNNSLLHCKNNLNKQFSEPKTAVDVFIDGYTCSMIFVVLAEPRNVLTFLNQVTSKKRRKLLINIHLVEPTKIPLDRKGNSLFEQSALERRELDHALAWFSTLGGAFSALGDTMANCAVIAGKISTQQFKLALRLGDPTLQSRCRLYMALSLIQRKHFSLSKKVIKSEYNFAISQYVIDWRLVSMCLGIWAKWKYDKSLARKANSKNSSAISL